MKLATFRHDGNVHVGVVEGDRIFDLTAAGRSPAFISMQALIEGGLDAIGMARELVGASGGDGPFHFDLKDVRLLAPLPEPRNMRDFMSFPGHAVGALAALEEIRQGTFGKVPVDRKTVTRGDVPELHRSHPVNYLTNRFSVVGPDDTVHWPAYSRLMDYELELGMVVGKTGADISREDAADYIFGFTIFNDFSARDTQLVEVPTFFGPGKAKSFDTGNGLGPWIVTADEVGDPTRLRTAVRVNGEQQSSGVTGEMIFSFEEMLVHVSRSETLQAGEIFGSGTVADGSGLEVRRFLVDGDVVELEVERIGVLRNRVVRRVP